MRLLVESHRVAALLPRWQRFELGSQLRRAATSVPANIAEGYGRLHRGDYLRHLSIARGSLAELETHFEAVLRLEYVQEEELTLAISLATDVGSMLFALTRSLRSSPPAS